MRSWVSALVALVCCAGLADARTADGLGEATTGITFFNRPGASLEEHQADLERCSTVVRAMGEPNIMSFTASATYNNMYSPAANVGAVLILAMVDSARFSAANERAENTHYQNCMVALGWRVVRLENATGRRLSRLQQEPLAEQLAPMIAATEPEGVVAREFTNDLAYSGSVTAIPTGAGRFISLSRLALPRNSEAAERRREPRRMPSARTREENEAALAGRRQQYERGTEAANTPTTPDVKESAPPESSDVVETTGDAPEGGAPSTSPELVNDLSLLPPESTLIVFRQRGAPGSVVFRRIDQAGVEQEAFAIGAQKSDANTREAEPTSQDDTVSTLAAPPGRWRMESMVVGRSTVSLCLGSPAFEIGAGEVVYAGDFNFGAEPFLPDMSLTPAQDALAATPHFAQRLRAASYANGVTSPCKAAQLAFAYEVPTAAPETTPLDESTASVQ